MTVTLNMSSIGTFLIGLGILVLIVFLIILVVNLISTSKRTNKLMDDWEEITQMVLDETRNVTGTVKNVSSAVNEVVEAYQGHQDIKRALAVVVNSVATIKGLFSRGKSKKED